MGHYTVTSLRSRIDSIDIDTGISVSLPSVVIHTTLRLVFFDIFLTNAFVGTYELTRTLVIIYLDLMAP